MTKIHARTLRRGLALAALLAFAAAGLLLAQAYGRLSLTIVDSEGKPIDGVTVTVTCAELPKFEETKKSNKKGMVAVALADATKVYTLKLEKEGYRSVEMPMKADLRVTTQREIPMQKLGVAAAGPAPGGEEGSRSRRFTPAERAFNTGVEAVREGDVEGGKQHILEALEKDPELAPAHAALAGIYLQQKQDEAAIASASRAVELDPQLSMAYRVLYEAYNATGQAEKANEALKILGSLDPTGDAAAILYNEGVKAFRAGDDASAKGSFRAALELNPDLGAALGALALILAGEGAYDEAIDLAQRLLAVEPDSVQAKRVLYTSYNGKGEKEKAAAAFEDLKATDPVGVGNDLYNEGVRQFNAGNIDAAIEHYELVLQVDPTRADAHYQLGLSYSNRGKNAEAREHLQKYLELAPNGADADVARSMLEYLEP